MASSGYDIYSTTWSPDGRVFQVEYSQKAVDDSPVGLALCCSDGIVFANQIEIPEKLVKFPSPCLNRVHAIDENTVISYCGMNPDGLCLVERARAEVCNWKETYGTSMSAKVLTNRLGLYVNQFTEYLYLRPFGASFFIGQYCGEGKDPELYHLESSGRIAGFHANAAGKDRRAAKTELEKLIGDNKPTVKEGIYHLIKILKKVFDETSSKTIELQVGFISDENPKVTLLPHEEVKQLEAQADNELEDEDDDDEDEDVE